MNLKTIDYRKLVIGFIIVGNLSSLFLLGMSDSRVMVLTVLSVSCLYGGLIMLTEEA